MGDAKVYHAKIESNLAVTGTYISEKVFVGDKTNFGIGIEPLGTFTGEIWLEASNERADSASPSSWFLVTDSYKLFSSEEVYYDVSDYGYSFVRVVIIVGSGAITGGSIELSLKKV